MSMEFYQTQMGQRFFCKQLPELIKALNRVADSRQVDDVQPSFNGEVANTAFVCYERIPKNCKKKCLLLAIW